MSECVRDCGTSVQDVYLCHRCTDNLVVDLKALEWLSGELETTLTRQHRFGGLSGAVARSAEKPVPFHPGASQALSQLKSELHWWCAAFGAPVEPEWSPRKTIRTILINMPTMTRSREDSGAFAEVVEQLVMRARQVVDRPPDQWYAGPCECGRDLYSTARRGEITCECGQVYDIEARRSHLLDAIEDQLVPTSMLCRALVMLGRELKSEQVRQWVARGKLTQFPPHPSDPNKRPRYRVGDVVNLINKSLDKIA